MNRRILVVALVTVLFLFFMVWSFGSLAAGGGRKSSGRRASYPIRSDNPQARQATGDQRLGATKEKQDAQKAKDRDSERSADNGEEEENDPDVPASAKGKITEAEYIRLRDEFVARLRGWDPEKPIDPAARRKAIDQMEVQEALRPTGAFGRLSSLSEAAAVSLAPWTELGPNPIPNGQTQTTSTAVSGRVAAIAIDPNDPNKVYVGAAQGGVFRSLDGGATWTPIFDTAQSLSIGALNLDPVNGWLWVGTGEANGSADCFAGVGLYRIENVNTTATLVGPINPIRNYTDQNGNPASTGFFSGRGISKILRVPNDPNTLFVGVAGGVIGIGGNPPLGNSVPPLAMRGLVRLTNVTGPAAGITGTRVAVSTTDTGQGLCLDIPCTVNRSVNDMVLDPQDPSGNTLIVWLNGLNLAGDGGIYRSTTAMAGSPTFTQTFVTTSTTTSNGRGELRTYARSGVTVIYAASGEPSTPGTLCNSAANFGALRRSDDGGVTWSAKLAGGGGFCNGQCFYNIGFDVLPGAATTSDKLLLGGNVRSTNCQKLEGTSLDGGATVFANTDVGLHADTHVIKIAPSNSNIVYRGDDGGIWKSTDAGLTWASLNNTTFRATQFQSIAIHPTDADFAIGGTQDNGTEKLTTGPTWIRSDAGDGGYALIDQNATNTTSVTMYHTYFNQTGTQIGYVRSTDAGSTWPFSALCANGISCSDATNFYAPMALGPGTPNTVYFGSDRLYRSATSGTGNVVVSQAPIVSGVPLSAIGISPQDDNYRVVGLNSGALFYTTTGSSTLTNLDPSNLIPNFYVARIVFDPKNKNTVYISLGNYAGGTAASQAHVWQVTNLGTAPVITSLNGTGVAILPDVPVNGFAVDPTSPNNLFAGTDIGVYGSVDTGAHWSPYGTGLPRVSVFDMAISNVKHALRIATHGRGMWEVGFPVMQFSAPSYNVNEGDGSVVITVTRSGDTTGTSTVDFASGNNTYTACNVVNGSAVANCDFTVASGTLTFNPGDISKTFKVLITDDAYVEGNETFPVTLTSAAGATLGATNTATVTIIDNDPAGGPPSIPQKRFFATMDIGQETPPPSLTCPPTCPLPTGSGIVLLNSTDSSALAGLKFFNLTNTETAAHIHTGAPGVAGPILFPLPTANPVTDFSFSPLPADVASLKAGSLYMNVHSTNFPGGEIRGQLLWNPSLELNFFVRQHYLDFLSREPDTGGLNFWISQIHCPLNQTSDQADVQCFHDRTIAVSDSFFFEGEFHQTAGFVFLAYRAAYGNTQPFPNHDASNPTEANKLPNYDVFTADRARVVPDGVNALTAKQQAFANLFVTRPEFLNKYPTATYPDGPTFVNAVLTNIQTSDPGVDLSSQQSALVTQYNTAGGGSAGRAMVLYSLSLDDAVNNPINNRAFVNAEYNRQFALTLYFAYLRRNPDIAGFLFWQGKINAAPVGDGATQQGLVCSFITSPEYQARFGLSFPRGNQECPQ